MNNSSHHHYVLSLHFSTYSIFFYKNFTNKYSLLDLFIRVEIQNLLDHVYMNLVMSTDF